MASRSATKTPFLEDWRRVTPDFPCKICGHGDWCVVKKDGTKALCQRVESSARFKDAGWMHDLSATPENDRFVPPAVQQFRKALPSSFLSMVAEYAQFVAEADPVKLIELAATLRLSVDSLKAVGCGFGRTKNAYTFPMHDHEGNVVGIRYRALDGRKFSFRGGREGVFRPRVFLETETPEYLIVEGATDTAAGILLGINTIGRPNCNGGTQILQGYELDPDQLIILADRDKHGAGLKGAEALRKVIGGTVLLPRLNKDLREIVGKYAPSTIKDQLLWAGYSREATPLFMPV